MLFPIAHAVIAVLVVASFHRCPRNPEATLLVVMVFVPGVVECLAKDVLCVYGQMIAHGRRQFIA